MSGLTSSTTALDVVLELRRGLPHNSRRSTMAEQLSGQVAVRGPAIGTGSSFPEGASAYRTVRSWSLQAPIVSTLILSCHATLTVRKIVRLASY